MKPTVARRKTKSREDWIAAARKTLVNSGVESIRIERLAKDLRTTRGSFYWHFSGREDLLDALLHDWEVENYVAIATIRTRWVRSSPDLNELVELWFGERAGAPTFDMAIRAWARSVPDVERVMHRVDGEWIALLQLLFPEEMYDQSERLVRARVVYFQQVGYRALALRESPSQRSCLIPYYYKVLVGYEPGETLRELLRRVSRGEATVGKIAGRDKQRH